MNKYFYIFLLILLIVLVFILDTTLLQQYSPAFAKKPIIIPMSIIGYFLLGILINSRLGIKFSYNKTAKTAIYFVLLVNTVTYVTNYFQLS